MITPAAQAAATQPDKFQQSNIGTEAFLTLLITQLRSQNPLEPMDPNEFVAQLAQFNSLSQLIEIKQLLAEANSAQAGARADAPPSGSAPGGSAAAPGGIG